MGGNKIRLIAAVHYNTQCLYIRHVLTHQGVVSEILAEKRSLNLEQIKKLVIGFMFHHWCLFKTNDVGGKMPNDE